MSTIESIPRSPKSLELSRLRDKLTSEEKIEVAHELSIAMSAVTHRRPLEVLPSGSLGSKDSAHDVFMVATPENDGKGPRQAFACKRFRRPENAQHELDGIHGAHDRGFQTLEPVGDNPIHTIPDIGHVLVTRRLSRFTTMNQLGLQDGYAGEPQYEEGIAGPLRSAASFVGHMHRKGITHGDLQLKNVGQVPPGKFVLFDLEGASFYDTQAPELPPTFTGEAIDDVGTLVNSMVDRGYMWSSSDRVFTQEVTSNVLDPYLRVSGVSDPEIADGMINILDSAVNRRSRVHHDIAQKQFPF